MKSMIRPTKQSKRFKAKRSRRKDEPMKSDSNMRKCLNSKSHHKHFIPKIKAINNPPAYIMPSMASISSNSYIPIQIPKTPIKTDMIFSNYIFICVDRNLESSRLIEKTLNFEQIKPAEIPGLFVSKCRVCCGFCNYKDDRLDIKLKQIKYDTLNQLYNAIQNQGICRVLSNTCFNALYQMICINIFRPVNKKKNTFEFAPDCSVCDKEWPHLDLIYLMFQYMLNAKFLCLSSNQIKTNVKQLFKLLYSPDEREQQEVCNCLGCFLKSYPESKEYISPRTSSFIQSGLIDEKMQSSLDSFLGFYNKYLTFLKPQRPLHFFKSFALPLALSSQFHQFSESFTDLMKTTLLNDPLCVNEFINFFLKHWPVSNFKKQTAYLDVLHQLMSSYGKSISSNAAMPLFKRIIDCFSDPTADISQQAMFIIEDHLVMDLLWEKADKMKNDLFDCLRKVSRDHWIQATRDFAREALDALMKSTQKIRPNNEDAFIQLIADNDKVIDDAPKPEINWNVIKEMAKKNCRAPLKKLKVSNNNENVHTEFCVKPPSQARCSGRIFKNAGSNLM